MKKFSVGYVSVLTAKWIATLILLSIILVLFIYSGESIHQIGFGFLSETWNPGNGQFGMLSMLYGSMAVTTIALVIALPFSIFGAIYIAEYSPVKYRLFLKSAMELLAGIPSIVYGLIGVAVLAPLTGDLFGLTTGRTIATAGIILALMVIPTILTLCEDAFSQIPKSYRENGFALGLTRYEVLKNILLPIAKPNVMAAILLGFGRAIGETMAVMLVIGGIDKLPQPIYQLFTPGQTLTSKLGREVGETAFNSLHFSALITLGLILLLIVLTFTLVSKYISSKKFRSA